MGKQIGRCFIIVALTVALCACGNGSSNEEQDVSETTMQETVIEEELSNEYQWKVGDLADYEAKLMDEAIVEEKEEIDIDDVFDGYEDIKDRDSEDSIIRDETLNGRGRSDSGRSEPQYENHIGYVAIYSDTELKKSDSFVNIPWTVPIYEEDKQFYNEIGTIDHKTEVLVINQDLNHEGYGNYSGKLLVESLEDGEQYIIGVGNFIVKPYWTYGDLVEAASVGDFIAEFNQVSDYYPVNKSNEKVELDDGTIVLIVGKTGHYSKGPDTNTNQLEGIVFKEWQNGYGGVSVFFNADDLTLVY